MKTPPQAFTMTEVALALGVVSFSILSLLALVPTALDTSRESRRESLATLAVRSLVATARTGDEGRIVVESHPGQFREELLPDGHDAISLVFAFDNQGRALGECDDDDPASLHSVSRHTTFLVTVKLQAQGDLSPVTLHAVAGFPADAKPTQRRKFEFTTLIDR